MPDVPGDDDDEEEEEDEDGDDGKEIPDELKQEAEKRAAESSVEGEFINQVKLSKLYLQIVSVVNASSQNRILSIKFLAFLMLYFYHRAAFTSKLHFFEINDNNYHYYNKAIIFNYYVRQKGVFC